MYNTHMISGYLTTKQASVHSGISQDHVRRLLQTGTVEGVKLGHDWLVLVSSLEHFMANRPRPGRKRTKRIYRRR
jgi:excisionase family DNA binding protein